MAEIAADAGVTERTFYRYYPTKQHVLFADYDARMDWFRDALRVRPRNEPITEAVRAAVESFPDNQTLIELAGLRAQLDPEQIRTHLRRLQAELAHEIEQSMLARGPLGGDDAFIATLTAQFISAAMFTAVDSWMNGGSHDLDELGRLADLALTTLERGVT